MGQLGKVWGQQSDIPFLKDHAGLFVGNRQQGGKGKNGLHAETIEVGHVDGPGLGRTGRKGRKLYFTSGPSWERGFAHTGCVMIDGPLIWRNPAGSSLSCALCQWDISMAGP